VVYLNADITYDREVAGEDEKALRCHDEMLEALIWRGYIPYRLGIRSVGLLPEPEDDYGELLRTLKKILDPNNILAPGRYGMGAERMEDAFSEKPGPPETDELRRG
jgi:4-cresol dehydrogenase (hydroxylating)